MEAKINIAEILKDKPQGTKLYADAFGELSIEEICTEDELGIILLSSVEDRLLFYNDGKYNMQGEPILVPSKEMRDWRKFAWKKGDVLISNDGKKEVFFNGFTDDTYALFKAKHGFEVLSNGNTIYLANEDGIATSDYTLEDKDAAQTYINTIEERLNGKLNRETLEVEKPHPEFKDGDIVMSDLGTIVLVRGISLTKKIYYHAYMRNEYIYINQVEGEFFSRISRIKRFATDSEKQQLFDALAKEGKAWDAEKKQIVDLKPAFEIGKLYVFNEEDEDGELTIIGKLIGKNEIEDTLTFGNQYEIENEKFVTDQAFDLRISVHKELREATEGEAITFHEAYTIWEKSKKQLAFKPFDKVLVRDSKSDNWRANLFSYIGKDGYYHCVYANWAYCIPYEGNEHLLGTTKDVEG